MIMDAKHSLENTLQTIIENEGLKNAEVEYEKVEESGYVCSVKVVNIKHDESVLSLFFKRLPEQSSTTFKMIYLNEMNFYKNVVGEFKKLGDNVDGLIPRCYHLDEEVIVLENLRASGMRVWGDLKIPLDAEHVVAVMEQYGKFHSLSAALKSRSPKVFNEISRKYDFLKYVLELYEKEKLMESIGRKAAAAFVDKKDHAKAFLQFVEGNLHDFLSEMYEDQEHDVIIHGDCWPHNFMFGFEESRVSGVYLIDFQLSFRASPIVDLSYFMCTSGCSKEHFDRMDEYLKIYHDSFSNQMVKLGCDAEGIIPFETLVDQWRRYGKYGLIFGMIANKMLVADKDEIEANRRSMLVLSLNFISRNEDLYHQRMRDSISYFYENDLL